MRRCVRLVQHGGKYITILIEVFLEWILKVLFVLLREFENRTTLRWVEAIW